MENIVPASRQCSEKHAEMDTGQQHRHDQDRFHGHAVEIPDAGVLRAESARCDGRHGLRQRVEPVHACQFQRQRRTERQPQVDEQQDLGDHRRLVVVVVLGHRRQLDVGQQRLVRPQRRKNQQREHHHADTAQPRRTRPPEEQPARQRLDVFQDRRTGGRITRHALEPGVDERELSAPHQIGEHPHHAGHDPRTHDDTVALLAAELFGAVDEDERESAQQGRQQCRKQQRVVPGVGMADQRHAGREEHEQRHDQHDDSHVSQYDAQSHRCSGFVFLASWITSSIRSFNSATSSLTSALILNGRPKRR